MSAAVVHRPYRHSSGQDATGFWSKVKDLAAEARYAQKLPAESLIPRRKASVVRDLETLQAALQQLHDRLADVEFAGNPPDGSTGEIVSMVARRELLEPAAFTALMGWSRQALSKALAAHRVFFVEHKGARYYPSFFGDSRYERRQVEAVTRILGDLPGGAKLQFFLNPKASLSKQTPLQALARGNFAEVKRAAEGFAQA